MLAERGAGPIEEEAEAIHEQQKQIEEMSKKIEFIAMRVAWGSKAWEFACLDKDRVQQKLDSSVLTPDF